MEKIPLELEGCEIDSPICREIREYLLARDFELATAGRVTALYKAKALDRYKEGHYSHSHDKVVDHLLVCPSCEKWLTTVMPDEVLKRQKRLADYCCAGLFCAVEEYEVRGYNRVTFTLVRGEDPVWRYEKTAISFCPWCGKPLPCAPY